MQYEIYNKQLYQCIDIKSDLDDRSDLSELKTVIKNFIAKGPVSICLKFTEKSWLCSHAITILIVCCKMIKNANCSLAIICKSELMRDTLRILHLSHNFISLYDTDEAFAASAL